MKQFYDIAEHQVIEPVMAVEVSTPYEFSSQVQSSLIVRGGAVSNVQGSSEVGKHVALSAAAWTVLR